MIPIAFFLGMNYHELLLFQVLHSILDFGLNVLFLYLVINKVLKKEYSFKKILLTGVGIELIHILSFFMWYMFVLYAAGGIVLMILFVFFAPYFVIYVQYTYSRNGESEFSLKEVLVLYFASVPSALVLGLTIISLSFILAGIPVTFMFG